MAGLIRGEVGAPRPPPLPGSRNGPARCGEYISVDSSCAIVQRQPLVIVIGLRSRLPSRVNDHSKAHSAFIRRLDVVDGVSIRAENIVSPRALRSYMTNVDRRKCVATIVLFEEPQHRIGKNDPVDEHTTATLARVRPSYRRPQGPNPELTMLSPHPGFFRSIARRHLLDLQDQRKSGRSIAPHLCRRPGSRLSYPRRDQG